MAAAMACGKVCSAVVPARAVGLRGGCHGRGRAAGGRWGRGLGECCLLAALLRPGLLIAGRQPDRSRVGHTVGDALLLLPAPLFSCREPEPPHI